MKKILLGIILLLLLIPTQVFADSNTDKQIQELKLKIEFEQKAINRYERILGLMNKQLNEKENQEIKGWLKKSIQLVSSSKKDCEDMIAYYEIEIKKLESAK